MICFKALMYQTTSAPNASPLLCG